MIQYIALAFAMDAENKASHAVSLSEAKRRQVMSGDPFVTVRPVDMEMVYPKVKGFWKNLFNNGKRVLMKEPIGTFALRRSDITNIQEFEDDNGSPFVKMEIRPEAEIYFGEAHMIKIRIPGRMDAIIKILNGRK